MGSGKGKWHNQRQGDGTALHVLGPGSEEELDQTEYRCWKEQELGSGRWGFKCQARSLALTEQATGSPCRFLQESDNSLSLLLDPQARPHWALDAERCLHPSASSKAKETLLPGGSEEAVSEEVACSRSYMAASCRGSPEPQPNMVLCRY